MNIFRLQLAGSIRAAALRARALTLDGAMTLDKTAPNGLIESVKLTAEGPVRAAVSTHLCSDTVKLNSGFVEQSAADMAGRIVTTVSGSLDSAAVGGRLRKRSLPAAPLAQYSADAYPRSGSIEVEGLRGRLTLTALSADTVQIDLDADGDDVVESSATATWDWVL